MKIHESKSAASDSPAVPGIFGGNGVMDKLQEAVYLSGSSVIEKLHASSQAKALADAISSADAALGMLKDFRFRVGFAGGQSCGKSMVINSLLDYPLSPACMLCSTATVVSISYGKTPRIRATNRKTGQQYMDYDCRKVTAEWWGELQRFACDLSKINPLENLTYFTDRDLFSEEGLDGFSPAELEMDSGDPRQVALLMLALLCVELGNLDPKLDERRDKMLTRLGVDPYEEFNVFVEWDHELLRSGMVLVDLPGLDSGTDEKVKNGRVVSRQHDEITVEAINTTDAMVFIVEKKVDGSGLEGLDAMISKASIRMAGRNDMRIIPMINKCDMLGSTTAAINKLLKVFIDRGIHKAKEDVVAYTSLFGESRFPCYQLKRSVYYRMWMKNNAAMVAMMPPEQLEAFLNAGVTAGYANSGIEELKQVFRNKCVELGKYIRTLETMQTLRSVATLLIKRMNMLIKLYGIHADANAGIGEGLRKQLLEAVTTPANEATRILNNNALTMGKKLRTDIQELLLHKIPESFIECCNDALKKYADGLLDICGEFQLDFTEKKARIDKAGSHNKRTFDELSDKVRQFSISTQVVDAQYAQLIKSVTDYLDEICNVTTECLKMQSTRSKQRICSIIEAVAKGNREIDKVNRADNQLTSQQDVEALKISAEVLEELARQIISFIDSQSAVTIQNVKQVRDMAEQARKAILKAIQRETFNVCNAIQKEVTDKVSWLCGAGVFFRGREYLHLQPSAPAKAIYVVAKLGTLLSKKGGVMHTISDDFSKKFSPEQIGLIPFLQQLHISTEDADTLQANISASGTEQVGNAVNSWMKQTTDAMNHILLQSVTQFTELIRETEKIYTDHGEASREKAEALKREMSGILGECDKYAQDVREPLTGAAKAMQDDTADTAKLQQNGMYGLKDDLA